MKSDLEADFEIQLLALKIPKPEYNYKFLPDRKFMFDFAWPAQKVAVEIEGGTWIQGRHTRGQGYHNDCIKYNLAVLHGWRILRGDNKMVETGELAEQVEELLFTGLEDLKDHGRSKMHM